MDLWFGSLDGKSCSRGLYSTMHLSEHAAVASDNFPKNSATLDQNRYGDTTEGEELIRAVRKARFRLGPFLALMFAISILDRSNVGFAKEALKVDAHIGDTAFALGAGIFFIGYAGCGVTSAGSRSGWARFDGRRGGGAHQGQGGDSMDDGDGGPNCCRVAGGAGEGDRDDDDGDA
jgi:hypothetical protein